MSPTEAAEVPEILLVEDNPGDARLVEEALSNALADGLSVVNNGAEAFEVLQQRREENTSLPTVILLDWHLPDVTGEDMLSRLKTNPEYDHIPVVVITGSAQGKSLLEIYNAGANACIPKPTTPEEFDETFHAFETFWLASAELPPEV